MFISKFDSDEEILKEGTKWLATLELEYDYILVMHDMGFVILEKILVELHLKMDMLFWTGKFDCHIDKKTPPLFISSFYLLSNWSHDFRQSNKPFTSNIAEYTCKYFSLAIKSQEKRIFFDNCKFTDITLGCSDANPYSFYDVWVNKHKETKPRAVDEPTFECYQGYIYDINPPSDLFPNEWQFGTFSKLPTCPRISYLAPDTTTEQFASQRRYSQEQTKVWRREEPAVFRDRRFTENDTSIETILDIYYNSNETMKMQLTEYKFTRDRYWLEFQMDNGTKVAADIRVRSPDSFCLYSYNYKKPTRFVFLLAASHQVGWLTCYLNNLKHLSYYFKNSPIEIATSVVFFYENENTEYIWDVIALFQDLSIPHYLQIINSKFSRAGGLHWAAFNSFIQPEDILILCDLHLDMSGDMVLEGYKHILKGDQMYAPIVVRMLQGVDLDNWTEPSLIYQDNGYGIMGMVASDFVLIGGMESAKMEKTTWGAEDWYFLDKVSKGGFRIHRVVPDRYVHYWHTRNIGTGWYVAKRKKRVFKPPTSSSSCGTSLQNLSKSLLSFNLAFLVLFVLL